VATLQKGQKPPSSRARQAKAEAEASAKVIRAGKAYTFSRTYDGIAAWALGRSSDVLLREIAGAPADVRTYVERFCALRKQADGDNGTERGKAAEAAVNAGKVAEAKAKAAA